MKISHKLHILLLINIISGNWMPELNFSPNFDQFQYYKSKHLNNILQSSLGKEMPMNFQWQSISSVSLTFNKISYIVYGGSEHIQMNSKSAFAKKFSSVVICRLSYDESEANFNKIHCSKIRTEDNNWNLGITMQTVSVSDREAVLTYCDPLWHVANISEPKPSGKCYMNYISNGNFDKNTSIEFCRLSPMSFYSCLGGFSIDLISTNKRLSGLQMIVGMPYLPPYGSVKIITDPFGSKIRTDPRNGIGKYFNFGYAVSIASMSTAYATAPLSDNYGPNVTNIRQEMVLTSPDNVPFSSFGLSLKTLNFVGGQNHAILIGAPFHSFKTIQNVGKTYIFCVSNANTHSWLTKELHGEMKDEFYGYALDNIGDINGDGTDDFAVSSPFLRDNDGNGFVSIYTINNKCELNTRPHQVLKNTQFNKMGIFGISISGGSDLDFNGWPDLVILNSHSNSIELYGSRALLKAQCKYIEINKFETEPLRKDQNIEIKLFIKLVDIRNNNHLNLESLKKFQLISQVNPNYLSSETRFKLDETKNKIRLTPISIAVAFTLNSLMDVKDMSLSIPIVIANRLVEDCSVKECNHLQFPLINWEECKVNIPVRKFICNIHPTCDADLSLTFQDVQGSDVIYGYNKMFSRTIVLKIFNSGPTEAKDVNFKLISYQNLRIHKIKAMSSVTLKEQISENQTYAICKLYREEIDVNSPPIIIEIDLYFVDFQATDKMKYLNNSVVVSVFSDVKDSNRTNNEARVDYQFVYEPNVTFFGSPSKDTVVDSRNRTQQINYGQRLAIDTIGPRLTQQYVVENVGNATITNIIVKIDIPMKSKDGNNILYIFDRIRGVNKSEAIWLHIIPQIYVGNIMYPCVIPEKYINPLNIIGFETHELHLKDIDIRQERDRVHFLKKRSVDSSKQNSNDGNVKVTQGKMYRMPVEIIQCNRVGMNLKSPICMELSCRIPILPPKRQAKLQVNAWLWAHTFFKKQISDIMIYSTIRTEFYDIPEGIKLKWDKSRLYSQSQQFIFQNVKPNIIHFKPSWPIIVGIVIGILILAILIVAMYKCGFFARSKIRRKFKSIKLKKEVHRPIILHPGEIHTASSVNSETRFTSHSALINSPN